MNEGSSPREHGGRRAVGPRLRVAIDWPLVRVEEERTTALRALLTTAAARSPWHRRRLEGLDIASMSDRDIVDLPVMTKTDLMDNFDSVVTDTRLSRPLCEEHLDRSPGDDLLGEFQVVASGGSSGTRGVYVFGWGRVGDLLCVERPLPSSRLGPRPDARRHSARHRRRGGREPDAHLGRAQQDLLVRGQRVGISSPSASRSGRSSPG